jgi:tetratricopeptide (TPR) repeat protein
LAIARETGDKRGEAINLGRLGDSYRDQGQFAPATEHYEKALAIARQMDDKRGEGYSILSLGIVYHNQGYYKRAIGFYLNAREIFLSLGMKHQVEGVDKHLAEARAKRAEK